MGKQLSQHEIIQIAAAAGATAAIERFEQEKSRFIEEQHDRRLRNTKLLLRNYQELVAHCESAIYEAEQVSNDDIADILEAMSHGPDNSLIIESIKKSAGRTRIIVEHIKEMMAIYESYCERSPRAEDKRRLRIIQRLYLNANHITAKEVAEEESIDLSTVYKDINAACERLTALIFGIDGMRK